MKEIYFIIVCSYSHGCVKAIGTEAYESLLRREGPKDIVDADILAIYWLNFCKSQSTYL